MDMFIYTFMFSTQIQIYLENLFLVTIQITTKKQLNFFTHMFDLWIPCHKLYKEDVLSYVLTLNYTSHFGMNSKKLNPKSKT